MGNKWDEMRLAYQEAENQIKSADGVVNDMANMLRGRLRKVNQFYLKQIKRELRDFNIGTGRWKE